MAIQITWNFWGQNQYGHHDGGHGDHDVHGVHGHHGCPRVLPQKVWHVEDLDYHQQMEKHLQDFYLHDFAQALQIVGLLETLKIYFSELPTLLLWEPYFPLLGHQLQRPDGFHKLTPRELPKNEN